MTLACHCAVPPVWPISILGTQGLGAQLPELGSEATVLGGQIKAACVQGGACAAYPTSSTMVASIASPANPVTPAVSLIAPTTFRFVYRL